MESFFNKHGRKAALKSAALITVLTFMYSSAGAQDQAIIAELDQGWTPSQRDIWYGAPQGSRLIPLAWLRALEQPSGEGLFLTSEYLSQFGYILRKNGAGDLVFVGIAIDRSDDRNFTRTKLRWRSNQGNNEPWVGLTCSACHTSELSYKEKKVRIYGGAGLGDFQSFVEALNEALRRTQSEPQKWERFSKRVLAGSGSTADKDTLKRAFAALVEWQEREAAMNKTGSRYGHARVDAFGRIFNKVALAVNEDQATPPNAPDAPVSIPSLWRAPQLDRVQYNGIAQKYTLLNENFDVGGLARNAGEVIGVFADIKVTAKPGLSGFVSSANVSNLVRLEQQLMTLRPPKWPESIFGKPKENLVAEGKNLYAANCVGCHILIDRTNLKDRIKVQMNLFDGSSPSNLTGKPQPSPGTDPWMACNSYDYRAASGVLAGVPAAYFAGDEISKRQPLTSLLTVTVVGALLGKKWEITKEGASTIFGPPRPPVMVEVSGETDPENRLSPEKFQQLRRCLSDKSPLLGYISRPLNGVWATPPYLHNGSVTSLYQLLLPPRDRLKTFYVGTREFDPEDVGLKVGKEERGNVFLFEAASADGSVKQGNSNAGHDYGNSSFSDPQRRAIVEYLKTL